MANRKLPFGYCIRNGQICIAEAEAEVVRMIFTSYAEGNSYETLAEVFKSCWSFVCQSLMGANMIVKVDIYIYAFSKIRFRRIFMSISLFPLKC